MRQKPLHQLVFLLGEAVLALLSSGVLFVLVSRIGGAEMLGSYALALSWLMLFQGVSCFGIPEFLMREVGTHGQNASQQVNNALVLGIGSGFIAVGLMQIAVRVLGYSSELVHVITISSLGLIPVFLNMAARAVFLAFRQMHFAFTALLLEVAITMLVSLHLLLTGYGAAALIATLVVAKFVSASISITLLYLRALSIRAPLELKSLVQSARTIFTFGIGNMLGMLTMRINVIMVSLWVDISTVGQFAAATKLMELGLMIPNLFVQLLMTRIAHSFSEGGKRDPNQFGSWLQILFDIVVPTCVGGWIFADFFLSILFGQSFRAATIVFRVLLFYLLIESADAVMSVILKAAHKQRGDVERLAFNPLTNFVLNLVLLPTFGIVGSAVGRVGGAVASATLRHRLIAAEMTAVTWSRYSARPALISIGVGALCYSMRGLMQPVSLFLLYVLGTGGVLLIASGLSLSVIKDIMTFSAGEADQQN
ncbi:MAG TPA: oligosaccharide flippase family protein [Candidatus Binataceae bacterium]|nr:oligosaccharide flippase family protein [Candidatus Binataceae bacterium]